MLFSNYLSFICLLFCFFNLTLFAVDRIAYVKKLNEPLPTWALEQIQEDLEPFNQEMSKQFLDELFHNQGDHLALVRVQIVNGKIRIKESETAKNHPTSKAIIPHIIELSKIAPLPDVDFVFTAHDAIKCFAPIFAITKYENSPGIIVIPDHFALNGFEPKKTLVLQGNEIYPWNCKLNKIFYRGSDAGMLEFLVWFNQPRTILVELSSQYPDLIDAKFTGSCSEKNHLYAKEHNYYGDFVSMKEHPHYKYLISVDAMAAATPRLPLILHSNSTLFKNNTPNLLWFFKALKPYVHYIPVAEDLSDLLTQFEWANTHEEECQKISENARILSAEALTQEAVYVYLYRLIEAYSKKQHDLYDQR